MPLRYAYFTVSFSFGDFHPFYHPASGNNWLLRKIVAHLSNNLHNLRNQFTSLLQMLWDDLLKFNTEHLRFAQIPNHKYKHC